MRIRGKTAVVRLNIPWPAALAIFTFAFVTLADAQDAVGLVGRWRSVETSHGGIGAMYEFRADGTIRVSPGAIVDMPYRVEGNQLILPPATTDGPEQKSTIEWSGKDLFRMSADHQDEGTYRRQGAGRDLQNPLVGEWLGSRQMEGRKLEMRFIFDGSGGCQLLIKFVTQQGEYSAREGRLVARINGATALDGTFEISDALLTIHRSGGRVTRLKRY